MRITIPFIIFILLGCCTLLQGQDPHFSQYFASPLTLNPALTGFFDGDYRLALNEREQWWNVGSNYSTTSISADFKILKESIPENDVFGIGFSGIFDKSLNGALLSNYISLSGAYHKNLQGNSNQRLTVGFQATFADRYIDYNKLSFASQFNVDFFDPTVPVNIITSNPNSRYFELNTGVLYSLHTDNNSNYYVGGAIYHVNRPNESIFNPSGDKIPFRYTVHGGTDLTISAQSSILLSGVYMLQGNVHDQLIGGAYGLKTSDDLSSDDHIRLYAGFWYRVNESYIPYLGIDYNNFSFGLNYNISASSISAYQPRTFEFALIYRHKFNINQATLCPRF